MTREEFEVKYAQKYMGLSFVHNPTEAIESVKELRYGEWYTDHHIDLCWKFQIAKDIGIPSRLIDYIESAEW